jgi:pimeloyl-ACP methyl ester carboxylesterase
MLLHGAWHDSQCWRLLTPLLQASGHTVITPDLPGHGASVLPPARATLKAYVQAMVDQLESFAAPVTLVGHSMAGMVITAVAARLPQKIERLIYLCAYLPQPGDSVFSLIARNRGHEPFAAIELAMEMSSDKRTCSVNVDEIVPLFYSDTPAGMAQEARTNFALQGSLPLAAPIQFDPQTLAAVARSYICCTRDKVIPLHHQRRMLAGANDVETHELSSDHSPFYSCPERLASMLLSLVHPPAPCCTQDRHV